MCIFAQSVSSVDKTNIFARLDGKGSQYLVYQMRFETETKNAMILPIPTGSNPTEESVSFIDFQGYNRFFGNVSRAFPSLSPPPSSATRSGIASQMADSKLAVQKVGDFIASVVPEMRDFGRLDAQFVIPPETWAKIPEYQDYSFVVFQLEELAGRPHPMAFRFDTRHEEKLFFPTVHIHDGEVHQKESFDHNLYCQHAAFDNIVGAYSLKQDLRTGLVRSQGRADQAVNVSLCKGVVEPELLIHRRQMKGMLANKDVLISAAGDPLKLSSRLWGLPLRNPIATAAAATGIASLPLAWIIRRRNKVQNTSIESQLEK